jgi:DNA-directed RNA polymerase specialized sigma subunit
MPTFNYSSFTEVSVDKKLIDQIEELMVKEGAFDPSQRETGLKLLAAFKKDPSKETFTPLYQNYKPLIYSASRSNTFGSPLPASAHWAQATQSFLDATRTFNPSIGAPFHIYAYSTIQNKGKRLNLKYQNIGYIPEARATKYQLFNNTINLLREQLGREPSTLEISDELKWSPKMVETMRKEIRTDYLMDEGKAEVHSLVKSDRAKQALQDLQYSLIPAHQLVLEHAVGLNGKAALLKPSGGPDLNAISKATKLSVPKIRSALKTITRKYKQYETGVLQPEVIEAEEMGKEEVEV